VTVISLEGEQLPGECCFQADGTFTLTAQATPGPRTRRGRYNYANGVLLMAWDRFQVREALHWVKYRRFTFLSNELLIFDRKRDAGAKSPLPKLLLNQHSPQTTEKTYKPRVPTRDQPFEEGLRRPLPRSSVHAAELRIDWALATLLIVGVGVLLLLGIKERGYRHPTNSTPARTGEVEKGGVPEAFLKTNANEGVNDAAHHHPRQPPDSHLPP
jgi:hypothetical protein